VRVMCLLCVWARRAFCVLAYFVCVHVCVNCVIRLGRGKHPHHRRMTRIHSGHLFTAWSIVRKSVRVACCGGGEKWVIVTVHMCVRVWVCACPVCVRGVRVCVWCVTSGCVGYVCDLICVCVLCVWHLVACVPCVREHFVVVRASVCM